MARPRAPKQVSRTIAVVHSHQIGVARETASLLSVIMKLATAMLITVMAAASCATTDGRPAEVSLAFTDTTPPADVVEQDAASAVAMDFLNAALELDAPAMWSTLHPEIRAETNLSAFTECVQRYSVDALPNDFETTASVTYAAEGITHVDIIVSSQQAFGDQKVTATLGLLPSPEGWGIAVPTGTTTDNGEDDCFPNATQVVARLLSN